MSERLEEDFINRFIDEKRDGANDGGARLTFRSCLEQFFALHLISGIFPALRRRWPQALSTRNVQPRPRNAEDHRLA